MPLLLLLLPVCFYFGARDLSSYPDPRPKFCHQYIIGYFILDDYINQILVKVVNLPYALSYIIYFLEAQILGKN